MGRAMPPAHSHQQAIGCSGTVAECSRAAIWTIHVGQVCLCVRSFSWLAILFPPEKDVGLDWDLFV